MTDPLTAKYGPCSTRLDNQPTPSARPWRYGHAASIEGVHWDIYAGEGIDGWLVGMVTTEADAALIVQAVNAIQPAAPAEGLIDARERLIGKIADVLDGEGGWERQSRAAIVRCIDEVFDPIIRAAKRADR